MIDASTWLRYSNQGAIRNKPIMPELASAMSFLPDLGVTMEVFSGGQDAKGEGDRRTGSTRHDDGGSADVFFYKDGRKLDWANPQDVPLFQEVVKRAKAAGVTGIGAGDGYMQPGSMHLGFGAPAVWGAEGKGGGAAPWLREAYGAAPAGAPTGAYVPPRDQGNTAAPSAPPANDYTRLAYAYANGKMTPEDEAVYERGMAEGVFPKAQKTPPRQSRPDPLAIYAEIAGQRQAAPQMQSLQFAAAKNATPLQRFPGI